MNICKCDECGEFIEPSNSNVVKVSSNWFLGDLHVCDDCMVKKLPGIIKAIREAHDKLFKKNNC